MPPAAHLMLAYDARRWPLLVGSSKHGTFLNGERIGAPVVLAEGDQLNIGVWTLEVGSGDLPDAAARAMVAPPPSLGRKVAQWISRYGPSEVVGTLAAVGTTVTVRQASGSTVAGAFAGSIAETLGVLSRDVSAGVDQGCLSGRREGQEVRAGRSRRRPPESVPGVWRGRAARHAGPPAALHGPGDAPDRVEPGCAGGEAGLHVAFYGPVLTVYEWRVARNRARVHLDRSLRTTASVRSENP
jgi:FHA domain-containing protein